MTTTPSRSAEEIGERVRAAFNDADLRSVGDLLDPNVRWGPPGDDRWGCHNRADVLAWLQQSLDGGARAHVSELVIRDGKLLIGLRVRGQDAAPGEGGDEERCRS